MIVASGSTSKASDTMPADIVLNSSASELHCPLYDSQRLFGFSLLSVLVGLIPPPSYLYFWTDPLQICMRILLTRFIVLAIAFHSYGAGPIPLQHKHDMCKQRVPKFWQKCLSITPSRNLFCEQALRCKTVCTFTAYAVLCTGGFLCACMLYQRFA